MYQCMFLAQEVMIRFLLLQHLQLTASVFLSIKVLIIVKLSVDLAAELH